MARKKIKKSTAVQRHVDRWSDLMTRIIKNPEIADRIPNHANLFFLNENSWHTIPLWIFHKKFFISAGVLLPWAKRFLIRDGSGW